MDDDETQYPALTSLEAALRAPRSVHLKRKDGKGRMPHDHYETGYRTIERCLQRMQRSVGAFPHILDLGAGSGRWGEVARTLWPQAFITGVEIRDVQQPEAYNCWMIGSWPECRDRIKLSYHLVIGNPPYGLAETFIRTGLEVLEEGYYLGFLLRLAFLEGQGRRDGLFEELPLYEVAVCSKRPSFQSDGRTNATAFAWFTWKKGFPGIGHARLEWM